jgi:hypothetical protein
MTIQLLYDNGQSEWILFYNDRTGNWEDDNNKKNYYLTYTTVLFVYSYLLR